MAKIGKRTTSISEGVDRKKLYQLGEAVKMVRDRAKAKFDETVEVAMNLGVDPRHADQMVRGVVTLPKGTGKTVRVGVFARGAKAEEATAAGAVICGAYFGDKMTPLSETTLPGHHGTFGLRISRVLMRMKAKEPMKPARTQNSPCSSWSTRCW